MSAQAAEPDNLKESGQKLSSTSSVDVRAPKPIQVWASRVHRMVCVSGFKRMFSTALLKCSKVQSPSSFTFSFTSFSTLSRSFRLIHATTPAIFSSRRSITST
jgi:hypothetical protein